MSFQANTTNKPFADNKLKHRPPCDSNPPCNNCKMIESSPDWICEDIYVPEVQYEPIRPKLLCLEKPKKSFWRQWFGEKYFSLKNNCICKTNKKSKLDQEFVCQPIQVNDCCPPPQTITTGKTTALSKPGARCPRRVCAPPSNSICGCHLYFNIQKSSRRKRTEGNNGDATTYNPGNIRSSLRSQSPTAKPDGGVGEGGGVGWGGKVSIKGTCRSSKGDTDPCTTDGYKYTSCKKVSKKENPSDDAIHIGVTLTKEETKYCPKNTNINAQSNNDNMYNQENDISGQILTLEIHKSGTNINQHKNQNRASKVNESDNNTESDIKPSLVPQSENYKREVEPMLQKNRRLSERSDNGYNITRTSQNICSNGNLDSRVLEILKKLEDIEKKMNLLERKGTLCKENKNIKIDIDGQKSTVSVHLRDGLNDSNITGYTNNERPQSDAMIEIKQKHLKSQSPYRNSYDHSQVETLNDPCSDKYENNNKGKQKIVIKLPNENNGTIIKHFSHTILPTEFHMCSTQPNEQSEYKTTWSQIANTLKMNSDGKCYCVTCFSRNEKKC